MSRRILISGGAGFVGFHLASHLVADTSSEILLVDNLSRGARDQEIEHLLQHSNVRLRSLDLTSAQSWAELGNGYDEFYHLAAVIGVRNVLQKPHEVVRVNALSTLLALDWFVKGGARKMLFSSTSEAYAWTQHFHPLPVPTPEAVPLALTDIGNPRSSYAGSKIFGELAVTQYGRMFNKPFVIVRYHNVYGPRMGFEHVIPELYQRALGGENPLTVYSADHTRAFCYVSDAVGASVAAMRSAAADGETLNIGNQHEEVTIHALAQRILQKADIQAAIRPQPAPHDPVTRRCPDVSKAERLLGFRPSVALDQGLELTLSWYKKALLASVGAETRAHG